MSRGIGGSCRKVMEDELYVLYEYMAYNLNEEKYKNEERLYDGEIMIEKSCLVEPEIHSKYKRMPSGRKKLITKRILIDVPYDELFITGKILVKNASNCWQTIKTGQGIIALHLIWKLFTTYQEDGLLPEIVSYHV